MSSCLVIHLLFTLVILFLLTYFFADMILIIKSARKIWKIESNNFLLTFNSGSIIFLVQFYMNQPLMYIHTYILILHIIRYTYPIFMICLVTICSIGILAIRIKKHIEHKKDEKISIHSFLQTQRVSVPVIDAIDNDEQVS